MTTPQWQAIVTLANALESSMAAGAAPDARDVEQLVSAIREFQQLMLRGRDRDAAHRAPPRVMNEWLDWIQQARP